MSVAMPTFTSEIRFDAGASSTGFELGTALLGYSTLGEPATWTNVSDDVRRINISRGKRRLHKWHPLWKYQSRSVDENKSYL